MQDRIRPLCAAREEREAEVNDVIASLEDTLFFWLRQKVKAKTKPDASYAKAQYERARDSLKQARFILRTL